MTRVVMMIPPWMMTPPRTHPPTHPNRPCRTHPNRPSREVTFGFFVRKKPAVQLLVNGEPVLAAVRVGGLVVPGYTPRREAKTKKSTSRGGGGGEGTFLS